MYSLTDRNTIILYFGVCFLNRHRVWGTDRDNKTQINTTKTKVMVQSRTDFSWKMAEIQDIETVHSFTW